MNPQSFLARNGERIAVRFVEDEDGELLIDLVKRLSPDSRYQRFHITSTHVTEEEIRRRLAPYLDVDDFNHVALVALVVEEGEQRAVGVARFKRPPGNPEAEVAVVVRDDWQRQGIGSQLMRQLAAAALDVGVERFVAWVHGSNRSALGLLAALDVPADHRYDDGEDYIVMHLVEPE